MESVNDKDVVWEDALLTIEPQINADGVHQWPFDSLFPIDVRLFSFDTRHSIRMNRHDYFEIFIIRSGNVDCQIQEQIFPMAKGDMVLINSTQFHTFRNRSNSRKTQFKAAALYFLPQIIQREEDTAESAQYLFPFLVQNSSFPHVIKAETGKPSEIFELMRKIKTELPARSERAMLAVKTYLKMILVTLVNHYAHLKGTDEIFKQRQFELKRLDPLFKFLEMNFKQQVTTKEAASILGMSESNFRRQFKKSTGQSFVIYLNNFRIAKAQEMLLNSDIPISEIGQEIGFCDQSYFGMIFRKFTGLTPLQYRSKIKSNFEY
jgi:AraC-like DNA-binding protein/mannose-6-phosphate isomerase-like protein (cupin superfamily)